MDTGLISIGMVAGWEMCPVLNLSVPSVKNP